MTVIKKSGRKEDFMEYKVSNSIDAANKGTKESLNLKSLLSDFKQLIAGKEEISTRQIVIIVCGLLYEQGLTLTLENYSSYDKR